MVNTGRPSRGCYMCRARRIKVLRSCLRRKQLLNHPSDTHEHAYRHSADQIKCDEGKPGCMRCQKSKRVCPGYRDAFELKLRDESKATKKKHNRRLNQTQAPVLHRVVNQTHVYTDSFLDPALFYSEGVSTSRISHSRNSSSSSSSSQDSFRSVEEDKSSSVFASYRHHLTIRGHMTTPVTQQAACYFLANFVLVPKAGTMRGYLDFVLPLLRQRNPSQGLLLAFSAVSLAALGTRPNSKALLPMADMWYLNALKAINSSLRDPSVASSDSTLASVMLMASFEQLTPSTLKIGGWASHIDGAVAVIKSRGNEPHKWQSKLARDIFIAVRAHTTIHCIANSKALDPAVDWMVVEADDPVVQTFATVNLKMAALRADTDKTTTLKGRSHGNIEKVTSLLQRAQALDQEYVDWIKALPACWEIKTTAWVDSAAQDLSTSPVHPGRVDAYGELWMAYKYNIVRSCRLFIYTTILRCVAWLETPGDYRLTPEYTTASRICGQLVEEIVASVPYFFGWNSGNDGAMKASANFACGTNDDPTVKPLTGVFVMWPLFAAAASDFASPSQRIFLRGRLKHVAHIMGINQALILSEIPLMHPSLYIMRERANLNPQSCKSNNLKTTHTEDVPIATTSLPSATPQQQNRWIPRTFGFGEKGFLQNAVAMKQHMTRYFESYELTGF